LLNKGSSKDVSQIVVNSPNNGRNSRNNSRLTVNSNTNKSKFRSKSTMQRDLFNTVSTKNESRLTSVRPSKLKQYGLEKADLIGLKSPKSRFLSPSNNDGDSSNIRSFKNNNNKPRFGKKMKLKPLKNNSAFMDPSKNRKKLDELNESGSQLQVSGTDADGSQVHSMLAKSSISASNSRYNRRYSRSNGNESSLSNMNFKLMQEEEDDRVDETLFDQIDKSTNGFGYDDSNKMYIEGSNGRKISIIGLKSPERNIKNMKQKQSQEQTMYQASTV